MPTDKAYQEVLRRLDERKPKQMSEQNLGELDAEIAGQKISLKNVSLATIAGVATLCLCGWIAYVVQSHAADTKEGNRELVNALREMTVAAREQNCLMRFDQKERSERADFCKQIAR